MHATSLRVPPRLRAFGAATLALFLATAVWVPNLHRFYEGTLTAAAPSSPATAVSPTARALASAQLSLWATPEARRSRSQSLRAENPEWDLMGRTFLVMALADMALRDVAGRRQWLEPVDEIIADTRRIESVEGQSAFLLPYGTARPFLGGNGSLFVDGEIALMLGVRQVAERRPSYDEPLRERVRRIERSIGQGPVRSGESYPDECWTFCNTTALAAVRIYDTLVEAQGDEEGRGDHADLLRGWVAAAKEHLVEPSTGLLVSSYTYAGVAKDGPEGSSLWMSARNLLLVDAAFARDQYARAKRELVVDSLGFTYAREWPLGRPTRPDVDSGPIVPWLGASAGSSGLALLGASAFGDREVMAGLLASVELAAFPDRTGGRLSFHAGNSLADAVVLASLVGGPVWDLVGEPHHAAPTQSDGTVLR